MIDKRAIEELIILFVDVLVYLFNAFPYTCIILPKNRTGRECKNNLLKTVDIYLHQTGISTIFSKDWTQAYERHNITISMDGRGRHRSDE